MSPGGFSLGTGVAVAVAADHPGGKLILEAPYTSIVAVAASMFRILPVRWLLRDQFHSDERIARVTAPLLIMHGEKDPAISIRFGERLFALAHEPKQFVRFPEGGHDNLDNYGAIETARHFIDASGGLIVAIVSPAGLEDTTMSEHRPMPRSSWIFPALAVLLFAAVTAAGYSFAPSAGGLLFAAVLLVILFGTVFAAVHHAEVIAERIGEPFGTLLLTLSVTIIEVALIATIMLGAKAVPTLARDTVFAVVMIVCNGLAGICLLVGGLRYREQDFRVSGANLYLSVLAVLATITLVLPNYTLTTPGPFYSTAQLGFISVVTVILYGVFLYTQTIRHRDYFIREVEGTSDHAAPAGGYAILLSVVLLLISLLAVVLLAKKFSLVVDAGAAMIGAPPAFAGIVVALLILLPESVAAVAAARKNDLQKSINLALGSSLATIGLTIPAVAIAAYALEKTLVLGLEDREIVLLLLTFLLSMLTFGTGRTNILFGLLHVVVFAVFVFLVFVP